MAGSGGRTRREILADAAKTAAAASFAGLAGCFPNVGGRWPDAAAQGSCADSGATDDAGASPPVTNAVIEVFREDSTIKQSGGKYLPQVDVVAAMLDAGLVALARQAASLSADSPAPFGGADQPDATPTGIDGGTENPWKILLPKYKPGDRIGLKVNCLNGHLPTSPALVRALVASLRDKLGVDPTNIVVWDRFLSELTGAGKYSADDLAGAKLLGTWTKSPDKKKGETEATVTPEGLGYGDAICPAVEGKSPRLSRLLTHHTDFTINCPVFKRHIVSGVTAAMKNIYGIIDIPGDYHDNLLIALPKLYALPAIRNSISLTIVDALSAVITGGTEDGIDASPKRILLSQDPVAMDSYALVLMNQLRGALPNPLVAIDAALTGWIGNAAKLGLGNATYSLVQV
jgi:hypothetical protein